MSKDTPEVGDVIMYHGYLDSLKGYVHTVENEIVYSICKDGHKINVCVDTIRDFYQRHNYLGKSKGNIEQLFEVKPENCFDEKQYYNQLFGEVQDG